MLPLHPAVAASLARWHSMIAAGDLSPLAAELLHEDVVFRSPAMHNPYEGAGTVALILQTAASVFQDFAYHREFATADGMSVVLEFSAAVGDRRLKGIDMIRFDSDGRIVEFEVMIRPLSGLQALASEMGARLAKAMGKG